QDINCRAVGRCVFGPVIDRELGDMIPRRGDPITGEPIPLQEDCGRHFLYARLNPDLSRAGLDLLRLAAIDPAEVEAMDAVANIRNFRGGGRPYASELVDIALLKSFLCGGRTKCSILFMPLSSPPAGRTAVQPRAGCGVSCKPSARRAHYVTA